MASHVAATVKAALAYLAASGLWSVMSFVVVVVGEGVATHVAGVRRQGGVAQVRARGGRGFGRLELDLGPEGDEDAEGFFRAATGGRHPWWGARLKEGVVGEGT